MHHALLLTMWAPLLGAIIIVMLPDKQHRVIKGTAIGFSAASLLVAWGSLPRFDRTTSELQLVERFAWASEAGSASLGVDGLSFPLVLLTTLLCLTALIASLGVTHRVKGYFAWFLLLEFAVLGVFEAQNWSLFYMFWELTLVPLFCLISIWGGENRSVASMTFLLYTLGGSIFMLLALITLYISSPSHSFGMVEMAEARGGLDRSLQIVTFLGFLIGFAVKIPAFPLHGWISAYVEAPAPVSMVFSGVLAKMGAYGLIRISAVVPLGVEALLPVLVGVALINIVYGALIAWRQTDLKALVAYSSMSHMGFVLLGIASLNATGFIGATMQMLTHGIITGALFLLVGALYERARTREITEFGGLAGTTPVLAIATSLTFLASMGLPGLAGFISELHTIVGGFERWSYMVVPASAGILITAAYCLRSIGKLFMGPSNPRLSLFPDLGTREILAVAPLGALMIAIGLAPSAALELVAVTVRSMASIFG